MVSSFHDTVIGFTQQYHTVCERRILPPPTTYEALAECNRRSVRITVDEVGIRRLEISFHPLSNTGYYQMTRTKRSVSEDVLRGSITILKRKHCIVNPTMECSCGVCRTKMQRRLFKRPITAFLVLISSISRQNPEIGLLLALHDQGLHRLCPPVRCPPVSW